MTAVDEYQSAYHQAVGWLLSAVNAELPGFVADQAARAAKFPATAVVLAEWARRDSTAVLVEYAHKRRVARFRDALMAAHSDEWTTDVIDEAALICAAAAS